VLTIRRGSSGHSAAHKSPPRKPHTHTVPHKCTDKQPPPQPMPDKCTEKQPPPQPHADKPTPEQPTPHQPAPNQPTPHTTPHGTSHNDRFLLSDRSWSNPIKLSLIYWLRLPLCIAHPWVVNEYYAMLNVEHTLSTQRECNKCPNCWQSWIADDLNC